MKSELLPCPFCGSPAKARCAHGEYWITCTRAGVCFGNQSAHAKDSEGRYMHGFTYYADAIAAWNTRAAQPTGKLPELPEAIGEIVGLRLTPTDTSEFWGYFADGYKTDKKVQVYTADQMSEYALAALTPASPWISVKDRLPDDGQDVIAYSALTNEQSFCVYRKGKDCPFRLRKEEHFGSVDTTFWTPPPESPND